MISIRRSGSKISISFPAAAASSPNRCVDKGVMPSDKENALRSAKERLRSSPYSYRGLIEELKELDEFTAEEAAYGADNCGADWNR